MFIRKNAPPRPLFAVGGRIARASGEQQSAAWGGGELPISHSDIEISAKSFYGSPFDF